MGVSYRWIVEGSGDAEPPYSWDQIGTVFGPWTERSAMRAARQMARGNPYAKQVRVLKWETATVEQRYAAAYEDLVRQYLASGGIYTPDLHALAREEAEAPITPVRPLVGLALGLIVALIRWTPIVGIALVVFVFFRVCS